MSAGTLQRSTTPELAPPRRPGLAKLTVVEMRKMIDTRAGFWLLAVIGLLSIAAVVIQLIWGGNGGVDSRTMRGFVEISTIPAMLLLPVLGILAVTSEWSQRTALATFTLVPERERVAVAKLAAASIFAVLSVVVILLVSALGNALALMLTSADGNWSLPASTIGQLLLLQVLNAVMGVGFGMLLLNTPAAIVLYFVLPTVFQIITATVKSIQNTVEWLDLNGAMTPLSDGSVHGGQAWAKLATSAVLWIGVPLLVGMTRLLRSEVK
jgi:ABC-2 type transport system permease protein